MSTVLTFNESHRGHQQPGHVERPERLEKVIEQLGHDSMGRFVTPLEAEPAARDQLRLAHTDEHIDRVTGAAEHGEGRLDADTYVTENSLRASLDAVGCVLAATRAVVEGQARTGFAAVRPPGHHATPSRAMGFCLFSNAAIGARWAQQSLGVGKTLILDFDVHHGNGTQDVFYEDESVMYMSIHQSPFYPGTGQAHERGFGAAEGTTINIPFPSGTGDASYLAAMEEILRPLALGFAPELIFISAGYDAHWKDLLGGMRLTTTGFARMVREICDWAAACCDGRVVGILEGGYHADALAESVSATIAMMNDPEAEVRDSFGRPSGDDIDMTNYLAELKSFFGS